MPVKTAIIGGSGHLNYIFEADPSLFEITAFAPGVENEDLSPLNHHLLPEQAVYYNDWEELLEHAAVDLLVNNTWFGHAGKITLKALEKGISVFAEKPLYGTLEELDQIFSTWSSSPASLGGMFGISYSSAFLTAGRYLSNEGIGDIRLIHAQKSYKLGVRPDFFKIRQSSTGLIPWVGSHGFDWILRFCSREVISVSACHSRQYNSDHGDLESSAACLLGMEDGVSATLNIDYLRPAAASGHGDDRIRLVGSEGILEIRDEQVIVLNNEGEKRLELVREESVFDKFLHSMDSVNLSNVWGRHVLRVSQLSLLARQSADEQKQIPVCLFRQS